MDLFSFLMLMLAIAVLTPALGLARQNYDDREWLTRRLAEVEDENEALCKVLGAPALSAPAPLAMTHNHPARMDLVYGGSVMLDEMVGPKPIGGPYLEYTASIGVAEE